MATSDAAPAAPLPPKTSTFTFGATTHFGSSEASRITLSVANYPFKNAHGDADVILQTADTVDFYVHRPTLRVASPLFKSMFDLPQPTPADSNSGDKPALPVIPITENAQTLDQLLRMCYLVRNPTFRGIMNLSPVLGAALKYQITEATDALTEKLLSFRQSLPLQVFAEACRHDLEDVAGQTAAAFCGQFGANNGQRTILPMHAMDEYTPGMDDVLASSYYRLLHYCAKHAAHTSSSAVSIPKFCSRLAQNFAPLRIGEKDQAFHPFCLLHSCPGDYNSCASLSSSL
ncbi:hypothetical protein DAEQUDRAFT_375136 [Daedalea quercina L-15889]|uniref:BTB domain-containing protein n=1 Tax=Daedalea quercina L-15889 TaxID=1314783 RepID=A0A165P7H0_9APHY|nr:hypothetical protein DAEQUDRAFT_375136 [Daedalea quercina L-15889]